MYGHIVHLVGAAERVRSDAERVAADAQLGALAASLCHARDTATGLLRRRIGWPRAMVTPPGVVPTGPVGETGRFR